MTKEVLLHLRVKEHTQNVEYLQELITAYCTTVPWESVSKIVKKARSIDPQNCLRLEDEFWIQSIEHGTGGTCYESNWAFYKLLQSLGFNCYLTINKIVDKSSVHSAIIVSIRGAKYIVDIGYPLYAPIPLVENSISSANCQVIEYRSSYTGVNEYVIENYPHPKPYLYHLTDIPVSESDYLKVGIADYCETGLFLDRIIIRKIISNTPTRFDSKDFPYNIHQLQNGTKTKSFIREESLLSILSGYYAIDVDILSNAFEVLSTTHNIAKRITIHT